MAANELTWKVSIDPAIAKAALADVRAEVAKTVTATQNANKSELSMRQQLASASSLQRQRSAALISEWKRTEKAAADLARGVGPVKDNLQKVTDIMQTLGGASASLQGPLGGVAGRLRSLASLSAEAGGGLGVVGVAAGAAVVGVVALTVASAVLAKEFIHLIIATAEWQGKLFDLSQQTGVSVETLNALEIAAGKTGGSIESISQSLVIFQGHLDDAQDASSDMGKKFAELGISTDNTEDSLRSAFAALAKMPEGFHQTNEAAELFGKRGGKQVLAILKETNGDIDSAVTKLGALAKVTQEEAAAADEFNDALKDVSTSVRGITALIVRDSIPQILSALKAVSALATKVISENSAAISAISTVIGGFVRGNLVILLGVLNSVQLAIQGVTNTWLMMKSALAAIAVGRISIIMEIFQAFKGQQETMSALGAASGGVQGESMFGGVGGAFSAPGAKSGGGGKGRAAKISEGQQLLNQLTSEYNRLQDEANKRTKLQIVLLDEKYMKATPGERALIEAKAREIEATEKSLASDKKKADATQLIRNLLESQTKAINDARLSDDQWTQQIVELEAELKKLGLTMDENTRKLLTDNAATQKAISLTRERIVLEETRIKMLERERVVTDEQRARQSGIDLSRGDEERQRRALAPVIENRSAIDQLFGAINDNLTGSKQEAALAGLTAITEGFGAMAQAAGAAAQAWILYGTAGQSVRQVTAQVLASITQMAIAKAAFELAEGFAMLAAAFFGIPMAGPSAAMHFKAAAMYGIVAGVTALAGRAVAGNSFAGGGGGGGTAGGAFQSATGGGSRSGGSSSSNGSAAPITTGSQRPAVVIHKFIPPPGYGEQIVIAALDSNHPEIRRLLERENR